MHNAQYTNQYKCCTLLCIYCNIIPLARYVLISTLRSETKMEIFSWKNCIILSLLIPRLMLRRVFIVKIQNHCSWDLSDSTGAFWFWPGLSPPGSGRTPGCTCTRTSSRAPSSGLSHRRPAEGGSRRASCREREREGGRKEGKERERDTDKQLETNYDTQLWSFCFFPNPQRTARSSLQTRRICRLHIRNDGSLGSVESQLEVLPGLVWVEGRVLEGVGEEAVHQGAEGYAVFPAGGEVTDVHPLSRTGGDLVQKKQWQKKKMSHKRQSYV